MKHICVIGTGYVGLVTGTCFADLGNHVVAIDVNEEKIADLKRGIMPIYEPGLKEMVERNYAAGRLQFSTSYEEGLKDAEFVFICVGTPEGVDGEADLRYVRAAAETIARTMDHPLIIINKSTVPVGTGDWVADIVRSTQPKPVDFSVVSCPEFLREGSALADFMHPDRTVLGSTDQSAMEQVAQLFLSLRAPIVMTDLRTAEMIKYASNAFLAARISFINEISIICEQLGADVIEVAQGMGFDKRIGHHFLSAGVGYGGSCFEGDETIFALNSPNIAAEKLEDIFHKSGQPFKGGTVEIIEPENKRVLAFDLETGRPILADVQAVTRRPYKGVMVTIKTSMGRSLRVTSDHPVILRTEDNFKILPAFMVSPGDQMMTLMELPEVESPQQLNLINLLRGTELETAVYIEPTDTTFADQYEQFAKHIPTDMLKYPHEIKRHNRMSLRVYNYLSDQGVLHVPVEKLQLYTAKGAGARVRALIPVDADFLRLCGYYLAEGYISIDAGRAGAERHRIGFTFHEQETEYISEVQRILASYGLKFIERNSTHATTTIVSSRIFAWLLRDILKMGTRSDDKALPRLALNVSADLRKALLQVAFSGDGSVTMLQQGKNMMFEYATVSKALADGITLMLQSIGVIPSIRTRMMNKSKQQAYILRVAGYTQMAQLADIFGDKNREKIETVLASYQRQIKQRGFDKHGAFATLTVQEVEYDEVDTTVYSLETSTGTVITSYGSISHNCFPKDVKALAYMAQTHGMHPQLLHAVMEINDFQRKHVTLKLHDLLGDMKGKTVGLLGLAFKENTDDIRESPALSIAEHLIEQGAIVRAYDPQAMEHSARLLPDLVMCSDAYAVAVDADAIVVATPWNEFKQLDMARIQKAMKQPQPVLIDGRNMYEPAKMSAFGFRYRGVGRGYNGDGLKAQD
jgi:UDPglucose 6-dehydrogenase